MFNFLKKNNTKRVYVHEMDRPMIRGTRVVIKSAKTGKILDEGSNSILYAGSINAALKDFQYYEYINQGLTTDQLFCTTDNIAIPQSYNRAIYGDSDADCSAEGVVCLFAIGVDGVENSEQASQKKAVQYESWIEPAYMVPFRMVARNSGSITDAQKQLYAQPYSTADMDYYYFKKFDQQPIVCTQYEVNGNQIITPQDASLMDVSKAKSGVKDYYDNYLISNQYNSGAQVIVEMTCRVTKEEAREWFNYALTEQSQQLPNISSIMICTAIPVFDDDGNIMSYKNIMPKSKRNITRELLLDEEKGLEIIYQYIY